MPPPRTPDRAPVGLCSSYLGDKEGHPPQAGQATARCHRRLGSPHIKMDTETPACPFCAFCSADAYALLLHVETQHSEGEPSPFEVHDEGGVDAPAADAYVECPEPDCGESVVLSELELHLDMHLAERLTAGEEAGAGRKRSRAAAPGQLQLTASIPRALRNLDGPSDDPRAGWRALFTRPEAPRGQAKRSKRLGVRHATRVPRTPPDGPEKRARPARV